MSARPLPSVLPLLLLTLVAGSAEAILVQQGPKVKGPSGGQFGSSVAVSAAGNTAVVGAPTAYAFGGTSMVLTRTAGAWVSVTGLVGTGATGTVILQGSAVALSADGNTVVAGGPADDFAAGAVWVFTRSGGAWSQQGDKLVGSSAVGAAGQGGSVAISADGNTILVGGNADDGGAGATWIFTRSGGVWSQLGDKLVGTGAVGAAAQGASVTLSADGNTAVVGGNNDDSGAGAAWVFTRSGGVWSQQGSKLVGTGAAGAAHQGVSVALSADGSTAIVGGNTDDVYDPDYNFYGGAAWVYTRSGGAWSQQGAKLVGTWGFRSSRQGTSVALTASGDTAVVGGPNDSWGALWVFARSGGAWSQLGDKLTGYDGTGSLSGGSYMGASVAISADGSTVLAGGPFDMPYVPSVDGAVWAFARVEPEIDAALDIPGDQGGWLRLTVDPSASDFVTSLPVSMYGVWRLVPESASFTAPILDVSTTAIPASLAVQRKDGRIFTIGRDAGAESSAASAAFPPGTWELVTSVPALQLARYLVAVPTLSNAAPNEFVVTASTTTPSVWYISQPMSGQSVDNLAPAPPAPFTAAYASGATHLHWGRNGEPDVGVYHLYRGSTAGFSPAPGSLIASQGDTGFVDSGPAGSFYKLSALDVNGNESGYALVTPDGTLDVGDGAALAFALEGVSPNPSRDSRFVVAFRLPTAAHARLELLDVGGRRVAAREVGTLGAGHHSVELAAGLRLPPGLYLVRLTQNRTSRVARVAVLE